jgi:hypothetical protein
MSTNPTIHVTPSLIRWAHARSGQPPGSLETSFPDLPRWEQEGADLTLGRLEELARRTRFQNSG